MEKYFLQLKYKNPLRLGALITTHFPSMALIQLGKFHL
jgi:hypothetical protein